MRAGGRGASVRLLVALPCAAAVIAASTLLGPTDLSWDNPAFIDLRVARVALGAVTGAGLAIGGAVFQALFRNPLATPYTLGISSASSLAAAIGYLSGVRGALGIGLSRLSLLAFAGAAAAMLVIYLLSRMRGGRDLTQLLLAGVCVSYVCSAGILLATYLSDRTVTDQIVIWMMGALTIYGWAPVLSLGVVVLVVFGSMAALHRELDLIALDDELAATRGVAVGAVVWTGFALIGLMTAVIVGVCGPIGFVGLMAPHLARPLFGVRSLPLLCGSALLGAAFLAACDALGRWLTPHELPVGVITNIVGAVFFFYLLARRTERRA